MCLADSASSVHTFLANFIGNFVQIVGLNNSWNYGFDKVFDEVSDKVQIATFGHTLVAKVHLLATLTSPQGYRNN